MGDLRLWRQRCRLWSFWLLPFAARYAQRNIGRIASQLLDGVPDLTRRLVRVEAEADDFGVIFGEKENGVNGQAESNIELNK